MTLVIDTENLSRKFGNLTAVEDLTLHVDEGEVFGFLGPNGAGKTTTVRMLCCLISKTSGTAKIGDYEIGNAADQQKIRKIIGLLPENVGLYDDLRLTRTSTFTGDSTSAANSNLLIISAVLLFVDAVLFFVSRSTFRREKILTKWK